MINILIPKSLCDKIEDHIQNNWVQQEFRYKDLQHFVLRSIEEQMEAEKIILQLSALMKAKGHIGPYEIHNVRDSKTGRFIPETENKSH